MTIDYFYAPISAYSYLGEPRLVQIAEQAGVGIRFKPLDIMPVFAAMGVTAPAKQSPQKLNYRRADTSRTAARLGMPLNPSPTHWPVPMGLAAKTIIAAELLGIDQHQVSMGIMTAIQVDDLDISSLDSLQTMLLNLNLPATTLLDAAQSDHAARILDINIREAIEQGIAGAPTYLVGSEMFFGQDRLLDLQWWFEQTEQ